MVKQVAFGYLCPGDAPHPMLAARWASMGGSLVGDVVVETRLVQGDPLPTQLITPDTMRSIPAPLPCDCYVYVHLYGQFADGRVRQKYQAPLLASLCPDLKAVPQLRSRLTRARIAPERH